MSKTTFFKDLGKSTNDLLDKDFGSDAHGFEIESKAPNGVKFRTTGSRKADGSVSGLIEPSGTCPVTGVSLKATIKTDKTYARSFRDSRFPSGPILCFFFPFGIKLVASGSLGCRFSDLILV
jgi:hypothetical protein